MRIMQGIKDLMRRVTLLVSNSQRVSNKSD